MASVDVVIPNYNYGRLLPACVAVVLDEGLPRTRVVIIDNASVDDSVAIARRLAAADPRVAVIEHAVNVGATASYNEGVDLAEADYLLFLCADDLLVPGMLAAAVAAMEAQPVAAVAIGRFAVTALEQPAVPRVTGPVGVQPVEGDAFIAERCASFEDEVGAHAMLVRTAAQKAAGHYDCRIPHYDDFDLLLRLARRGVVLCLDEPIAVRRIHATNLSVNVLGDRFADLAERSALFAGFFQRDGAAMPQARTLAARARRRLAASAYWSGIAHAARADWRAACRLLGFAVRHSPRVALLPPVGALRRMPHIGQRIRRTLPAVPTARPTARTS